MNKLGSCYLQTYKYDENIKLMKETIVLAKQAKQKRGLANAYNTLGSTYWGKGMYPEALKQYFEQLKMSEELKDSLMIGKAYHGIGLVNGSQGNDSVAVYNYTKAGECYEAAGDLVGVSRIYNNIGQSYEHRGKYEEALKYFFESLKVKEKIQDKSGTASNYNNIGIVYDMLEQNDKAIEYYLKSVAIRREIGQTDVISGVLANLGAIHIKIGKNAAARKYLEESKEVCLRIENKFEIMSCFQTITQLDSAEGNFKQALADYKTYIAYRDSLINEENIEITTQQTMQYEFNKQQATDSIRNAELAKQEALKHDQKLKQQKIYTWGGGIGFVLMLFVAGVSFRAYREKQKTNTIISEQKALVEEKQKEILDSIHYAKRIQQGLLPTGKYISRNIERMKKDNL